MVIFLVGPVASGKTFLRKELFPDAKVVDIYEYQKNISDNSSFSIANLAEAEDKAISDFKTYLKKMKKDEDVIFESSLSNSDRRRKYAEIAREYAPEGTEIACIFVNPEDKDVNELIHLRYNEEFANEHGDEEVFADAIKSKRQQWLKEGTMPSKKEGFDYVLCAIPILSEVQE